MNNKCKNFIIKEEGYVTDAMKKKFQEIKAKKKKQQSSVTQINNNNRVVTVNRSK